MRFCNCDSFLTAWILSDFPYKQFTNIKVIMTSRPEIFHDWSLKHNTGREFKILPEQNSMYSNFQNLAAENYFLILDCL